MIKPSILMAVPIQIYVQLEPLLSDWYNVGIASDLSVARSCIRYKVPDLILLDSTLAMMSNGNNFCHELKADSTPTQEIPIIMLAGNSEQRRISYRLDVSDCIMIPSDPEDIKRRIAVQISMRRAQLAERSYSDSLEKKVLERTVELRESQRATIHMLGEAGHFNDPATGVHIWRMAAYSAALAAANGWSERDCNLLELAAPMHDTGKIGIPDYVLKKSTELNHEEWIVMKTHAVIGRNILQQCNMPLFRMAAEIAYCHHEKWDGSGYPQGLQGEDIPEAARIVAIADVFDALTMKRPYKNAWTVERSLSEINKGANSHFDPALCQSFLNIQAKICSIKKSFEK